MLKKMRLFFLNSLGNPHVTAQGEPRPHPSLARGSGPTANAVDPPKTQVVVVRMRPREFLPYHMDENSGSSTNIRALRVRVRVTGL